MARRGHTRRDAWAAVLAQPRVQEALRAQQARHARAPVVADEPLGPAMNKTEARYVQRLELARRAGEISDYRFTPITLCVTTQLRRRRRYTPDFFVLHPDGAVELVEVKGSYVYEDARLKFEMAVEQWNGVFAFTWAKWSGGEWIIRRYPRRPQVER